MLWPRAALTCAFLGAAGSTANAAPPGDAGTPSLGDLTAVCRYVESIAPASVRDYTVRSGVFDVNSDGISETVIGTYEGTMAIEASDIRDAEGETVEISPTYDWSDYWTFGQRWLLYDGRAYILNFADGDARFLKFLSFVDRQKSEHIGCELETEVNETFSPKRPDHEALCAAAGAGRLEPLPFEATEPQSLTDRENTTKVGTIRLDFDNDGTTEDLVALEFESGAGRGCDANYYDLSEETAASPDGSRKRSLLMRLQDIDPTDVYPARPCGLERRWLTLDGETYFELRYPGERPEAASEAVHWLATVRDGGPMRVCDSRFSMRWHLKGAVPPAQ